MHRSSASSIPSESALPNLELFLVRSIRWGDGEASSRQHRERGHVAPRRDRAAAVGAAVVVVVAAATPAAADDDVAGGGGGRVVSMSGRGREHAHAVG